MRILHLTQGDYRVSTWSGGTTTELFIWPQGADYSKREFSFRISSATVDLEESDFTPLPGVERYILPITGGFTLQHPGKPAVTLDPMDAPYRFSGGEQTHCVGKATDFNLMCKGVAGEMTVCSGKTAIRPGFNSFYAMEPATFQLEGSHAMAQADMLVVFAEEAGQIDLGDARAIVCYANI